MRRLLTRAAQAAAGGSGPRRLAADDGVVGGVEALPFGLLVFVVGTLIVVNAWGVVDAKMSVATAAREAARAYVEAAPGVDPEVVARETAVETMRSLGRTARAPSVEIAGRFVRCARVTATVSYRIPALRLPWVGGMGSFTARSTATEIVDPLRSGLSGEATCVA